MPVKEADPRAKALDAAFAAAQAAPAKPRDVPPPPEVDHEAPHGRGDDGKPLAPYGHNKDGSVKRSAAGRKPKDDQPRVSPAGTGSGPPEGKSGGKPELEPRDFSAPLMDFGETAWFGGSVIAKVGPQVPLLGKFIPGKKMAATMAVFDAERPRLAMALNLAAQHDRKARRLAEKLADGEAGWALTCMFMIAPFTGAVAAVWQTTDKHDALAERELPGLDELAQRNEDALDRMFARIAGQMEAAQQAQAQAMTAQQNGQVSGG